MGEPFHLYNIPADRQLPSLFYQRRSAYYLLFPKTNRNPFRIVKYCQICIFSLRSLFPESTGKTGSMVVAYSSVTSFINTLRNVDGTLPASLFSRTKAELGEYVLRYTFPLHSPGRRVAKKVHALLHIPFGDRDLSKY